MYFFKFAVRIFNNVSGDVFQTLIKVIYQFLFKRWLKTATDCCQTQCVAEDSARWCSAHTTSVVQQCWQGNSPQIPVLLSSKS